MVATNIMSLPTELHIHISSYLSYPDALALKHTNPQFYSIVYTGVHSKIDWLLWRFEHKLECPRNEDCSLRTDASFCKSKTVKKIMQRRRRHLECRAGEGGCFVVLGGSCRRKDDFVIGWMMRSSVKHEGMYFLLSMFSIWWITDGRVLVLVYGLLFVFWMMVWQAVRMYVKYGLISIGY